MHQEQDDNENMDEDLDMTANSEDSMDRTPEQFVTLEIPTEFPADWACVGYTHIHFGAIRLALNYHGTTGKPVVARIALLDSRYLEYQNACIATIEATLSSGLVMSIDMDSAGKQSLPTSGSGNSELGTEALAELVSGRGSIGYKN
ncbi:hypothetical protein PVK06_049276 [Gossypium arboreum]|uniref:Uncharacterized protein n=1 Tax=Gossypium arboreum TaxID=29729 RepID=A0ABR0MIA7_GOSAR|nr:hypothetical protein PVK06_049276 [Gossypium arboreum]